MSIEKDKWTEEVMGSLEGMQRAEAPPFLFTRITGRLEAGPDKNISQLIPIRQAWLVIGCILMLCFFNIRVLQSFHHKGVPPRPEKNEGRNVYQLDKADYQLY